MESEFGEMAEGYILNIYGRSIDDSAWHYAVVRITGPGYDDEFDHYPVVLKVKTYSAPTLEELFLFVQAKL